jgi:hypothetical protein
MSDQPQQFPDGLVERFLEPGPIRMSDRLFDAIVDDVYRTRQRGHAPWRSRSMPRFTFAAAVIAVVIAVASLTVALTRPSGDVMGRPSPAPATPTLSPAPATSPSLGPPGSTLSAATFTEPFSFTMPAFPNDPPTTIIGSTLDPAGGGAPPSSNRAFMLESDLWGVVTFHDDETVPADMCRPSQPSNVAVPSTPDAVGRWLESSAGLLVSGPLTLTVDGRPAKAWDVTTGDHCDRMAGRPPPWFGPGERHRVYAVPTGSDTILVITWGVDFGNGSEEYLDAVNAATDDLVQSMKFGD